MRYKKECLGTWALQVTLEDGRKKFWGGLKSGLTDEQTKRFFEDLQTLFMKKFVSYKYLRYEDCLEEKAAAMKKR